MSRNRNRKRKMTRKQADEFITLLNSVPRLDLSCLQSKITVDTIIADFLHQSVIPYPDNTKDAKTSRTYKCKVECNLDKFTNFLNALIEAVRKEGGTTNK